MEDKPRILYLIISYFESKGKEYEATANNCLLISNTAEAALLVVMTQQIMIGYIAN